jgi:radical SAM superfamily enzyme YgiQ (UPF0313 family)
MVIGGPYFAQPEVRREWCGMDGLAARIGGEVELQLADIVLDVVAGADLNKYDGVWTGGTWEGAQARPLHELDLIPFPDYSDFPWSKYPKRIVPMITGRGCGWGACSFCSDITSTAGRTYRSRSPQNVLDELAHQHDQHQAKLYVFTDLKMNSDLGVWRGLVDEFQERVPGGKWIGSVHVDAHHKHGLSEDELRSAFNAGMVRMTTGLESGSQRVLELMKKGADLEITSGVLRTAARVGISVRVTMIVGYPGEEARDVVETAEFLERHAGDIERVMVNRFQIASGTRFHRSLEQQPEKFPQVTQLTANHRMAQLSHHLSTNDDPAYRRGISRVLQAAHQINRRPLRATAQEFEGVM